MIMTKTSCALALLSLLFVGNAFADDTESDAVKWSSFFDGYYGANFNRPSAPSLNQGPASSAGTLPEYVPPSQNGGFRTFDLYHNQFALNVAAITVAKKGKEVGFKSDFVVGELTDVLHNSVAGYANGTLDEVSKHVGQAVVTYTPLSLSRLTVSFGKMYSHMGLETIYAKDNWNYSRSDLFSVGSPDWHLGASFSYVLVPSKVTATAYIYNGWNNLIDNNPGKTFGLQVAYTPTSQITVAYNGITGAEGAGNSDYRTLNEIYVNYALSPLFSLGLDGIYGRTNLVYGGNWKAVELLGKWVLSPRYYLSPRLEGYWDPQGVTTYTPQTLTEVTLTNGFHLSEGLETRIEGRWDHSSTLFFGADAASGPSHNQVTAVASVLYTL